MSEVIRKSFISTKKEHLNNVQLDYGIYSYLIEKSHQDEDANGNRFQRPYIFKKDIGKYSEMLESINKHFEKSELRISEITLKRRFTALVNSGILEKGRRNGKAIFILPDTDPKKQQWYARIETDLLLQMSKVLNSDAIKLYCLYYNLTNKGRYGCCTFSQTQLAEQLGYTDRKIIGRLNESLERVNLIKREEVAVKNGIALKITTIPYEETGFFRVVKNKNIEENTNGDVVLDSSPF